MQNKYSPSLRNQMKWELLTMWMASLLSECIWIIHIQQFFRSMAKDPFVMHFQAAFKKDLDLRDTTCFTLRSFHIPYLNKESTFSCAVLSSFWQVTTLGPDCTQSSHGQRTDGIWQLPLSRAAAVCPRDQVLRGCPGLMSSFRYSALPPLHRRTSLGPPLGVSWKIVFPILFKTGVL